MAIGYAISFTVHSCVVSYGIHRQKPMASVIVLQVFTTYQSRCFLVQIYIKKVKLSLKIYQISNKFNK